MATENGFGSIHLKGFQQSVWPYTDPDTGEEFPPTFDWYGHLIVMRTDGTSFYSKILIPKADVDGDGRIELRLITAFINSALDYLETFRLCACQVGKPCEDHAV